MYLLPSRTYYRGTAQFASRAPFLLLLQRHDQSGPGSVYAVVRMVSLRKFGHFMMGKARIGKRWESISGAYGADGFPMTVDHLPRDAVKLPLYLYEAWKNDGGWNGVGSESKAMRTWAIQEFKGYKTLKDRIWNDSFLRKKDIRL